MKKLLFKRAGAYLLDIALLFAVLGPLGVLVQGVLGLRPTSANEIYATLLVNFSIPVWLYFTMSDASAAGSTIGKRVMGLRTSAIDTGRVEFARALGRTAIKMLPWEITHASAFLFVPALGSFALGNWLGIASSYVLVAVYVTVAARTGGGQSVHDMILSTRVLSTRAVGSPAAITLE